ncbi:integrase, catalytic region, zinc finger, CCHC-type containing protein [Tanacetum coccineum]
MFIFSYALLLLWAEAIAIACYTQNCSIIHQRFDKTPYELINGGKPDISFLYVFGALYYPKNNHEDIGKLGVKGDIGFFICYSANSCAYRTLTTSTTTADTTSTPTNSSSQAADTLITLQDVDELQPQQHVQQKDDQAQFQSKVVADNVLNAMSDEDVFENLFALPSTSAAESSSSQYVDPSNMHTFYQPYQHEYQWTDDHPLEQVIGEPLRLVLTRNQLRTDGEMCIYALTVSTIELRNVKEAMTDPA